MLLAVDLVVGAGCEVGVGRRVLGLYGVAEVVQGGVGGYGCFFAFRKLVGLDFSQTHLYLNNLG